MAVFAKFASTKMVFRWLVENVVFFMVGMLALRCVDFYNDYNVTILTLAFDLALTVSYLNISHRRKMDTICADERNLVELLCSFEYVLHIGGMQFLFDVADLR